MTKPARLFASVLVLTSVVALAPPSRADEAAARQQFQKGVELYDRKQYSEALEHFRTAYREKPSAGIKQNIALCLKGQGKAVEAAIAFDEALDEGQGTLKPETRAAIERELADISKSIATITFKVVDEQGKPVDSVALSIERAEAGGERQKRVLPPGAHRRPIRLEQGIWIFTARAPGYPDPPEKKLGLIAGSPVDATFVLVGTQGAQGSLSVRPSVVDATVKVDGVEVGRGAWSGSLPAGNHKVEVSASGYKTTTLDVGVTSGASLDQPVAMQPATDAPPPYASPERKPPRVKRAYVVPLVGVDGTSYRFSGPLDDGDQTVRKGAAGLSVGVRGGYMVLKMLGIELHAELGGGSASYKRTDKDGADTKVSVGHWQLTPMLRFRTPGKVRFTTGMGVGVHGVSIDADVIETSQNTSASRNRKGSGIGPSWLFDAGLQIELGPIFLEMLGFVDVFGVTSVRENDAPHDRMLQSSPALRAGARFGLGIPF